MQALDTNGSPTGNSTTTAADGTYTLTGLPTGTVEVHFDGNGQNFVAQYYNGKSGFSSADGITVTTAARRPLGSTPVWRPEARSPER